MIFQIFCTALSLLSAWASGSLDRNAWIFMMIASISNALLYYSVARYGHMMLDIVYLICAVWGFSLWSHHTGVVVSRISMKEGVIWLCGTLCATLICWMGLQSVHSQDSFVDSLSLVTGVVGVLMMGLCRIEQWGIWLIHDAVNLVLSLRAGLYIIALKQAVYAVLAVRGLQIWYKNLAQAL